MKNLFQNLFYIVLVLVSGALLISFAMQHIEEPEVIPVSQLVQDVASESVARVEVQGDTMKVFYIDESIPKKEVKKEYSESFSELMSNYGVEKDKLTKVAVEVKDESGFVFWLYTLGPWFIPLIILGVFVFVMFRQAKGMNNRAMGFGQTTARQKKATDADQKTFKDIAGANEAKEELEEVVDFLKQPKKFADMGAKIPRGVLLMGSPGTGKTLLAKAVAGEAKVPFFHISGSEFVEMFVGVGASRVRDLFSKAKKTAPAIVFIDEIDAVGRKRGAGVGGSHDEREQTLNQILVEMDGFEPNSGVIVIAATNRPDVLDQALLRPGRFDRRIVIDMPDIADREAILEVHAKGKPIKSNVSIRKIAERTPGFSGADLANLLNEAAILAVRKEKTEITEDMIMESIEKVLLGPEKKTRVMTEHEREMTAYHEAGHAIVGHFLPNCDPVRKVSIIGRGRAGGYTLSMPETDVRYQTRAQFRDTLAMIMGGYVTEKLIYGEDALSTGPSSDLKKATAMAQDMVKRYGMSDALGPRNYGEHEEMIFLAQEIHEKKDYSEKTAELIDAEIGTLLTNALATAEEIIKKHRDQMDKLVKRLLETETVEQDEFNEIMGKSKKSA